MQMVGEISRNGLVGGFVPLDSLHRPNPYVPQSGLGMLRVFRAHEGGLVLEISTLDLAPCFG